MNIKKGLDYSVVRYSLKSGVRKLLVRITLIAISVSLFFLTILFLVQAKAGLDAEAYSFLLLGRDSITTLQRELSYDSKVGYDYAVKYIKDEFQFSQLSLHGEEYSYNCLYSYKIAFHKNPAFICLDTLSEYKLIIPISTLKGLKHIALTKNLNPISPYFSLLLLSFFVVVLSISIAFYSLYREFISMSINPFIDLYKSLLNKDKSIDSPYVEIYEIGKNISENLEKERQIDRLKAIADTVQMVAHDVRKPMRMISRFIDRMKKLDHAALVPYADANMATLGKVAEDTERLIQDILDINHKQPLQPVVVDVNKLIRELVDVYFGGILVTSTYESILVMADAGKLTRAMVNILNNAVEASGSEGNIWITTRVDQSLVTIEIGNTSSSIESNALDKVFTSFWTCRKKNGRGLGMAITQQFILAHSGEIWCESNGVTSSALIAPKYAFSHDYVAFFIKLPLAAVVSNGQAG